MRPNMGKYNIAGINLDFTYSFNDYFPGKIEKYQINNNIKCDYKLTSTVTDVIPDIIHDNYFERKNKRIYDFGDSETVAVYDKNKNIIIKISYDKNYNDINIVFNECLKEKLSEYEYIITGLYFFDIALKNNLIPIHASAIKFNDEGILFSAPSGIGKSTHANLWKQAYTDVVVINDDKPLIKNIDGKLYVFGSPWSGKSILNENIAVRLKSIVFLKQNKENYIEEITDKEKLTLLFQNTYRPIHKQTTDKIIDEIDFIIKHIPIYVYHCNKNIEAAINLHNKLYKGE